MTRRAIVAVVAAVMVVAALAWGLTVALERIMRRPATVSEPAPVERSQPPPPQRHITATLFFAAKDAQHLIAVQREVPYGEGAVEQGRQIALAQIAAEPQPPHVRVVPATAKIRSFYISENGQAFLDLTSDIVSAHPGGSAAEQLTVYAIVNAIAANLPAVTAVQLLVDGKEADTLAGHIDIRRPLRRNDALVKSDETRPATND